MQRLSFQKLAGRIIIIALIPIFLFTALATGVRAEETFTPIRPESTESEPVKVFAGPQESTGISKWWYIVGGVVVAGGAAAVALGGKKDAATTTTVNSGSTSGTVGVSW